MKPHDIRLEIKDLSEQESDTFCKLSVEESAAIAGGIQHQLPPGKSWKLPTCKGLVTGSRSIVIGSRSIVIGS